MKNKIYNSYNNVLNNVKNKKLIVDGCRPSMRRYFVKPQIGEPPYTILSENIQISLDRLKTRMNNNVFVIGMKKSEKSKYVFLPNLLEANSNYVVNDVNGEYYYKTKDFFKQKGYDTKVLDLTYGETAINDEDLIFYNPFAYAENEIDIDNIVQSFLYATRQPNPFGDTYDPIYDVAEKTLMNICALYLYYTKETTITFYDILKLLSDIPSDEIDARFGEMVKLIEEKRVNQKEIEDFRMFVAYNKKIYKALMISLSIRLTMFQHEEVKKMTTTNNIDLKGFTQNKQILFVVTSSTDKGLNFLASILHMQLYNIVQKTENFKSDYHIRCILDEFLNMPNVKELTFMMATGRERISYMIGVETLEQLKTKYQNELEVIVGNCDSIVFLGTKSLTTADWICERLGKNKRKDEIIGMNDKDCIVLVRGMKAVYDDKYKIEKHQNYKEIREDV